VTRSSLICLTRYLLFHLVRMYYHNRAHLVILLHLVDEDIERDVEGGDKEGGDKESQAGSTAGTLHARGQGRG